MRIICFVLLLLSAGPLVAQPYPTKTDSDDRGRSAGRARGYALASDRA